MRGLILGLVFFALLPRIFTRGPFFGILMWFWISLMVPQKAVWGSAFASIPYAMIVAVLTLIGFVFARNEPKFPPFNKTTVFLVMLGVWISLTSWLGVGPNDQIYDKWELAEKMLLMTLVGYTLVNSRTRVEQLLIVCVLSIGFWGFRGGLIAIVTGGAARVWGPGGSMIGDNNDLGVALTMILPLMFYLRDQYRRTKYKWPVQILLGLTILGDIFTYSRGALVAMTAMGASLWLRSRHKLQILLVLVVAGTGLFYMAPTNWTDRMLSMEQYNKDPSAEGRLMMWRRCWELARQSPFFGGGFHWSYDRDTVNRLMEGTGLPPLSGQLAPHSSWFEMLGDHGFPGLALFLAILGSTFVDAQWLISRTRRRPELLWANNLGRMLQVALIGYSAGASFATQGMYDGLYAIVIIAAAARRVVAAEFAVSKLSPGVRTNFGATRRTGGGVNPQPSG